VIFADDNAQFLDHTVQVMAEECQIVGTAGDGPSALDLVQRLDPDIVVLDITMPILDGLDVARRLRADGIPAKIIFLTVHDDPDYLREALAVGATGYVVKHRLVSDLSQAMHDVLAGRRFVSASPNLKTTGSEENP
jgi:DNA-binding NarL/FixJ family response regulator